ncbi:hypothetical protein Goklo_006968 [Gossypium klotzschianum]|uniref:DC1 domain-containing protein n=2 Tax=Gossypium klotzschianum TaxID=34286 RepID=A0A7J8VJV4_9ROSI|nr:hypothetical protein [Gossypium klotzschianum]
MLDAVCRCPLLKIKKVINTHSPCFGDKLDRGSYSCGKPGCNYIVHVNCVLEDNDLYKVIDDEKQWEELYEKSMQSSIISVIKVNEAGEATKIEHFSHQHCLVLADKMVEEIDRKCDGCSKVADIIECEGHQHFLFYDFKCREKSLHKIDEHMRTLTYDNDKEQWYYDICEQERDPNFWYYSCSICGTSTHPKCVLGNISFLKDGMKWPYVDHPHRRDLKFFRNVEGYSKCTDCGKLCPEDVIKCEKSTCNYITHFYCPLPQL